MGINPKNRDDMFLAKAAGEEVDFSTIKPSTPVSDREKLLVKLGEKIDGSGSGGGSGIFIVHATVDTTNPAEPQVTLDKTYAEIEEAYTNGKIVLMTSGPNNPLVFVYRGSDTTFVAKYINIDYAPYDNSACLYYLTAGVRQDNTTFFNNAIYQLTEWTINS